MAWGQTHKPLTTEDWQNLLINPQPTIRGAEDFFLLPRWFHREDITSLKAFLDLPETQAALRQADQSYEAYMSKLDQAVKHFAQTRYSGLMTDFAKELAESLDQFLLSQVRRKPSPVSEREAEQIVRPNMVRKYGRFFDLADPNQKREFEREKMRVMLAHERPRKQNAINEEEFYAWQAREYQRLQERRKQNVFRIYELILELFPGELILGQVDPDQTMDLHASSNVEMTRRDLREGILTEALNYEGKACQSNNFISRSDVNWSLQMRDGTQYGIATRSTGGPLRLRTDGTNQAGPSFYFPTPQFTDDRYRYANMMSFDRQAKLVLLRLARNEEFKALNTLESLFKGKGNLLEKMKFNPNLEIMRLQFEKVKDEVRRFGSENYGFGQVGGLPLYYRLRMTKSDAELKRGADDPVLNQAKRLFWIGGSPSHWSERDKESQKHMQIGTDISNEKMESMLGTVLYSDSLRLLGHGGDLSKVLFNGQTNAKPDNHQKTPDTSRTYFKIERAKSGVPESFYELADLTQALGTQDYKLPISPSQRRLWVHTEIPQSTEAANGAGTGLVNIPTPEGHALADLSVTDADGGAQLVQGKDYSIRKVRDRNAYIIQVANPAQFKNVHFQAGFTSLPKQGEASLPPLLAKLNIEDLHRVIRELRDGKFIVLAEGLTRLLEYRMMQEKDISILDVVEVFKSHSLYSFNPVPGQAFIIESAIGPFAMYARFVNEQGIACIQCSGANTLFRLFVKRLYLGNEKISTVNVSGFQADESDELRASDVHLITDLLVAGSGVIRLDATPSDLDLNKPSFQVTKVQEGESKNTNTQNEKFLNDLRTARKRFHSHIEALEIASTPNDWWVRTGRLSKIVVEYFSGEIELQGAKKYLRQFYPEFSHEIPNHGEFIKTLRELALRELTTLNRFQNQAVAQRSSSVRDGMLVSTLESILTVLTRVDKEGMAQPQLREKASTMTCRAATRGTTSN